MKTTDGKIEYKVLERVERALRKYCEVGTLMLCATPNLLLIPKGEWDDFITELMKVARMKSVIDNDYVWYKGMRAYPYAGVRISVAKEVE